MKIRRRDQVQTDAEAISELLFNLQAKGKEFYLNTTQYNSVLLSGAAVRFSEAIRAMREGRPARDY